MSLSTEDLEKARIQMDYYLSDTNLEKDSFFHQKISAAEDGYIDLNLFLNCNKIKAAKWTIEDIKQAAEASSEIELDASKTKVRRKDNKKLPELKLLSQKRKKEKEDPESESEEKKTNDPIILTIKSEKDTETKWKDIIKEFKEQNSDLDVVYGRFNKNEGNIVLFLKVGEELKFSDEFTVDGEKFKVNKSEGDELVDFWKNHGSHYEMCSQAKAKRERKKNKGKKTSSKGSTILKEAVKLGEEEYKDVCKIRVKFREIMAGNKDGEKLKKEDQDFILDLMKYHHNYEGKIKDMDYITTGKPEKYESSRCFLVVDKSGKSTDFSIQKCIDNLHEQINK